MGYRVKDMLKLVHSDLCDPMTIQARGSIEYFIYFVDKYKYIYLMYRKTKYFDQFKEYKADAEKRQSKSIKTLR